MKNFIKNKLLNYIGLFEGSLLFYYIYNFAKSNDSRNVYIFLIFPVYILYVNFKGYYKIIKSNRNILKIARVNRGIKASGSQGGGKTSFLLLMARLTRRPIYSLTPAKISGKFVNVLTNDHLTLKTKIEENAILILDEVSLKFSNIDIVKKIPIALRTTEIIVQLIRHFFNGSIWIASVDTDRAVKLLREKITFSIQMLGQSAVKNSFILGPFINTFTKWKWYGYFRTWKMQTYEKIEEENYFFDLSNDEENTKSKKFANLLEIYSFNNESFMYNDRCLKSIYDELNVPYEKHQFKSLNFDKDLVREQYKEIFKFLIQNTNYGSDKMINKEVDKK